MKEGMYCTGPTVEGIWAMRSPKVEGWSSRKYFCIPVLSNWNVPMAPVAVELVSRRVLDDVVDVDGNAQ